MSSDDTIPIPSLEFMTAVGSHDPDNFTIVGQHVFELVRDRCTVQPDGNILDIGSGCGRVATHFTRYMSGRGSYDGFDVVLPMVVWCVKQTFRPGFRNFALSMSTWRTRSIATVETMQPVLSFHIF